MPLSAAEIFKLLEFQFKEGPIGIGFFMIKLIWSHYEPVTKLSVVLMCLTTVILTFYQVRGQPPDSMCSRVYRCVHTQTFCLYFWRRMSHFYSNSYCGVQVTYALGI